jgi:hypothetical protein
MASNKEVMPQFPLVKNAKLSRRGYHAKRNGLASRTGQLTYDFKT